MHKTAHCSYELPFDLTKLAGSAEQSAKKEVGFTLSSGSLKREEPNAVAGSPRSPLEISRPFWLTDYHTSRLLVHGISAAVRPSDAEENRKDTFKDTMTS